MNNILRISDTVRVSSDLINLRNNTLIFTVDNTAFLTIDSENKQTILREDVEITDNNQTINKIYADLYSNRSCVTAAASAFVLPYSNSGITVPATWSTSGTVTVASRFFGETGNVNSAVKAGGNNGLQLNIVELFNGSTWSTSGVNTLSTNREGFACCGVVNASLISSGYYSTYVTTSEKFNGISWTETTGVNTARRNPRGIGKQNASLTVGGYEENSPYYSAVTETFNGTAWTVSGSMNTARRYMAGVGSVSTALCFSGYNGVSTSLVSEKFNGSTWSVTVYRVSGGYGASGAGTPNEALSFGGYTTQALSVTEKFNGTLWYVVNTGVLTTARYHGGGVGSQTTALSFSGLNSSSVVSNVTEKWLDIEKQNIKIFTSGLNASEMWSTTGSLNEDNTGMGAIGTQNNALAICGRNSSSGRLNQVQIFGGLTWSMFTGISLTSAREYIAACGPRNDCLVCGGTDDTGTLDKTQISYGYSFISTNVLNTARTQHTAVGRVSAALAVSGYSGAALIASTESFNGASWSNISGGDVNYSRYQLAGAGKQNAAVITGGWNSTARDITEVFNGSTWSVVSGGTLSTARYALAASGTQNAALCFGGYTGSVYQSLVEKFTGNIWVTTARLTTTRQHHGGVGTQTSSIAIGGRTGSSTYTATCEKFNAPTLVKSKLFIITAHDIIETEDTDASLDYGSTVSVEHVVCGHSSDEDYVALSDLGRVAADNYWVLADTLNEARCRIGGCGIQNATVRCGGYAQLTETYSDLCEKYNGTAWSSSGDLNTENSGMGTAGVQNSALCFGGYTENDGYFATTQKFNGMLWSYTNSLSVQKYLIGGVGTSNAALCFGGNANGSNVSATERFNGKTWSTSGEGSLTAAKYGVGGVGTQYAALCFGGYATSIQSTTERNISATWTSVGQTLNVGRIYPGSAGVYNNAICFGGAIFISPYYTSWTEKFNGTVWSMDSLLITAKSQPGSSGSSTNPLCFGGETATDTEINVTEKKVPPVIPTSHNYGITVFGKNLIVI